MSRAAIHALARRTGTLDTKTFRDACSLFGSGVTVATVRAPDGSPHGLTVSSFTPVSIEPPLILICIDHGCTFLQHFRACSHFAVNILAESQRDLSITFACKDAGRFKGVDWNPSPNGVPLLHGCIATFECQLAAVIEAGDHAIFLGEVVSAECQGGEPLLYFNREYRSLD
ncbi:MAG TPA: flavin reductase family protein [Bryobacteraceae bacterium]|nr:flavin reductase family protein [Bryobacteraceae bacterium]